MFENFIKRENKIFEILQEFNNAKLNFIVIGGYGVSSYKHRFSVDADIIIEREDKKKFEEILKRKKFIKMYVKDLNHICSKEFMKYEIKINKSPVGIDLMIDGAGSRDTGASYSFDEILQHSKIRKIIGSEKEVSVYVPNKEILIVLKLHAGRLTDIRDVVALTKDVDLELIKKFIFRGKISLVEKNIEKLFSLINNKGFMDSFKGVFIEKKYDVDLKSLNMLKELIKE